jgi:flagellar motor switch protein FliG
MGQIKGFESALEALRSLDSQSQERILADILKKDPEMAEKLRRNLIVFDDLLKVNPKGLAQLFQAVPDAKWVMALRGKDKNFVESLLQSFPSRKKELFLAALDHLGPQPVNRVEAAQKEILGKALELEKKGLLLFSREGDPLV